MMASLQRLADRIVFSKKKIGNEKEKYRKDGKEDNLE